jgi:hypothetical protein
MTQRPKRFTSPASTAQFQLRIILEHQDTGTDVESIVIDQNVTVADFAACVAEFTQRVGNLIAEYETDPRYNPPALPDFAVGDQIRLTASDVTAPVYLEAGSDEHPTLIGTTEPVPQGAAGEILDLNEWGTDDAEIVASVSWREVSGQIRSAIVYLSAGSERDFGLEKT